MPPNPEDDPDLRSTYNNFGVEFLSLAVKDEYGNPYLFEYPNNNFDREGRETIETEDETIELRMRTYLIENLPVGFDRIFRQESTENFSCEITPPNTLEAYLDNRNFVPFMYRGSYTLVEAELAYSEISPIVQKYVEPKGYNPRWMVPRDFEEAIPDTG